jgi:flagellar hook-associated protein 1 FlgK
MASDLLSIAASGARAARGALDVTAQNIANASSDGYVRRSARMEEVSAAGGQLRVGDISLSGVRISGIARNADMFRQAEVRRTGADASRATAELGGLQNIESAVEQAGIFPAIVDFEGTLQQLGSDPVDPSLRAAVVASAETMANKFNIAAASLASVAEGAQFEARAGVDEANVITSELARINVRLARAGAGSSDRASLLDQRDLMLERLSGIADISTSFGTDGAVSVRTGGSAGPVLVSGGNAATMGMTVAADGTLAFDIDGAAVTLAGGSLAGRALALREVVDVRGRLDALAGSIATLVNDSQASGAALDGSAGQPLFTGTTAGTLRAAFTDGSLIATAPAGSPAGSRDASTLATLRTALETGGTAETMNGILFDISSRVAGHEITTDALDAIAASARISLEQQAGVDLDTEAANLLRYQQAFQASGRAMQVATDIFDTLIGIG